MRGLLLKLQAEIPYILRCVSKEIGLPGKFCFMIAYRHLEDDVTFNSPTWVQLPTV